ncbi:MAG: magnesium-translocating P-type ATPase [Candidatus Binatia bacterium]|jgi:Mg2+-importing ATPase
MATASSIPTSPTWRAPDLREAAALDGAAVLARLGSTATGLTADEATRRLQEAGPNALRSHGARALGVLFRQLENPLLLLLAGAAAVSFFVAENTDGIIILAIVSLSVGLGFFNEYRSERAVAALHSQIRHKTVALRDGRAVSIDVTELVPGDVVRLALGDVVPADLRLLEASGLECDEAVLTGESMPAAKSSAPTPAPGTDLGLSSCALMGTVVHEGAGSGVVVRTGLNTVFGQIAIRLGERLPQTAFQVGLRSFSLMLVAVAAVLTISIFVINVAFRHPLFDALLFSLAIAIGLTPQLLPAIVTVSLSTGAQRLARCKVLVKRLVSIEDLGNIEVLFTDKTGTLTEGRISFAAAVDATGAPSAAVLQLGLLCNDAVVEHGVAAGGNPLDCALLEAPGAVTAPVGGFRRLATAPFDYDRRMMSVLVQADTGRRLIVSKGAPESVLSRCREIGAAARTVLDAEFAAGHRVIAVATREASACSTVAPSDEHDLVLAGFLTFVDPPKRDASASLARLHRLGIVVKVVTGDNERVAQRVCADLGLRVQGTLTGVDLERMDDAQLAGALPQTMIFARVSPDQKSRIIRIQQKRGADVAFLGDGVNDAVALHDADVGISVDTATDVAKDAADIVLLDKSLAVLADGVVEGRRIFANTIKYVLMATSSNFGNMFSAAGASLFLKFLPMLPTQILLNNLLYDVSQMTIPTDNVDEELLRRPARWDIGFIRRFMLLFGPISSVFDFITFGVMLWVLHAGPDLFRSGWFVESLATQTLVIFVIRTRRVPFVRSRPSLPLLIATLACAVVGAILPFSPLAHLLGFRPLPASFLAILILMIGTYLALVELAKVYFFAPPAKQPLAARRKRSERRVQRVATRWSHPQRLPRRSRGTRPGAHGSPLQSGTPAPAR